MIQVRLKPEVEAALSAEAQDRGIALDRYVEEIVESRPAAVHGDDEQRHRAVEEMMQFGQKYRIETGGQEIQEMLHEGHRY